jgi:hypothetical protein
MSFCHEVITEKLHTQAEARMLIRAVRRPYLDMLQAFIEAWKAEGLKTYLF